MSVLNKLNGEQKEAAGAINGPLLILAGAGSGKTRTLTHRIAYMINECGVNPYSILAVTFTNKAAKEMKERVASLIGDDGEKVFVSTFHSFGVRMLRMYGDKVGYNSNFNIYDADDQKRLVTRIQAEFNLSTEAYTPAKIVSKISKLKEEGVFPAEYEKYCYTQSEKMILKIYTEYQKSLRNNNVLDFADILIYADELLNNKEVMEKIQQRFIYVLVDEYQDTNKIQYNIIKKIADKHKNICVVGDEDQSIYGFRGADIRNILSFEKDYKNAKVIKLEKNYRSTSIILNTANAIIKNNKSSKGKKLWTDRAGGEKIKIYEADTGNEEADYVSRTIKKLRDNSGNYKDFTILYRTNAQSRQFEETFMKYGIPYKIYGGLQFYQRKEIKDIIAYLNVLNNPADNLSFLRIINVPARGIGDKTVEKFIEFANTRNKPYSQALYDIDSCDTISGKAKTALIGLAETFRFLSETAIESTVSDLMNELLKRTSFIEKMREAEEEDRVENIFELKNSIYEIEKNEGDISLSSYLEKVSLTSGSDEIEENDDYVKLMTIHMSKGLEFPVVFIVGMEEEIFPGVSSQNNEDELEEDRRLCYVAVTRAKDILYISYAKSRIIYGTSSFMREPSRFISEIPKENIVFESQHLEPYGYRNTSITNLADLKKEISGNKICEEFDSKYNVGDYVIHSKFGEGRVKNIERDKILIYFPNVGEKKFLTSAVETILTKA